VKTAIGEGEIDFVLSWCEGIPLGVKTCEGLFSVYCCGDGILMAFDEDI